MYNINPARNASRGAENKTRIIPPKANIPVELSAYDSTAVKFLDVVRKGQNKSCGNLENG